MIEKIKELLAKYEAEAEAFEEEMGDDFNACDASGGNFDDAYYMGTEHGQTYGKIEVLYDLLEEAE